MDRCIVWDTIEWTDERRVQERCTAEAMHSAINGSRPAICCAHWPKQRPTPESGWAPCEHANPAGAAPASPDGPASEAPSSPA